MHTNHRIDQDGHWQQFGTQPILISATQWPNRSFNVLMQFYRVGKKPSVKADLVIYSYIVNASGQCMSVSLILYFNLDFSSCDIMVRFVNPVTYVVFLVRLELEKQNQWGYVLVVDFSVCTVLNVC